ncbi:MAG: Protein-glutamate methylesterase [uncultured Thermomicrobiales bacterium]|uniref:protein-glutamate methylesterase n=1 Tax=uncultured Thermomicrobiales bacterium TaxID=1645740 RepID=A0A6J4V261_9BACT|nr:MAG: Protein-glutamate methylesterase [uncultured Thermomicrobiales bacterium]
MGHPEQPGQRGRDMIVIGASSGGVEALLFLVERLPRDLPAAIGIVLHTSPDAPGMLARVLGRRSTLPVHAATDGAPIVAGRIYVAPPDHHLLVEPGRLRFSRGPRENRSRPAVDPLFRSAALVYGPRAIGVILTGSLDDGTAGLAAIKERGGMAIVQDPAEALFPGMPGSARRHVAVDHVLPLPEMIPILDQLTREPIEVAQAVEAAQAAEPTLLRLEDRYARGGAIDMRELNEVGKSTALTCPECHGPLWEIESSSLLRFRCRTGHAFSAETMLSGQSEALEDALWMAVNTLEESAPVAERLAGNSEQRQQHHIAARFIEKARESRQRAAVIREVIESAQAAATIDLDGFADEATPLRAD